MKTWLFCLGIILIAQPLAAQSPAAPTNVVLNLTPTDSLGLFLPGYDVMGTLVVEQADTTLLNVMEVVIGTPNGTASIIDSSIPWSNSESFFHEGLTVKRVGTKVWVALGAIPYSSNLHYQVTLLDSQAGVIFSYSGTVALGQ